MGRKEKMNDTFHSLNDDLMQTEKRKANSRHSKRKFYLGGKMDERGDEDDIRNNDTLTGTSMNSPLRSIDSEDSIKQLRSHAEEVVSFHAQRFSESILSSGSMTSSSLSNSNNNSNSNSRNNSNISINDNDHNFQNNRNAVNLIDVTEDDNMGLPLPVTEKPRPSILGNLLDLYVQKLVLNRPMARPSSTATKANSSISTPANIPSPPAPARLPLSPLRPNNRSGGMIRTRSYPSIVPTRNRSNSAPSNESHLSYPPRPQLKLLQNKRRSQQFRNHFNSSSFSNTGRDRYGPLTPVDENQPRVSSDSTNVRSRSSSIDSTQSYASVHHLLKSFPNHSNFHQVEDHDNDVSFFYFSQINFIYIF